MDYVQILEDTKTLLGIDQSDTSKDGLLNLLVLDAEQNIKTFCNNDFMVDTLDVNGLVVSSVYTFPNELISAVRDIAVIAYRVRGAEGKSNENIGGLSSSYLEDLPKSVKRKLYPFRLMVVKNIPIDSREDSYRRWWW